MVEQFSNRAKEILRISWNEPRDRALHLLLFFFAVAAILILTEKYTSLDLPILVKMFALQAALLVSVVFFLAKGVRFRFQTKIVWVPITLGCYFFGLFLLDSGAEAFLHFSSQNTYEAQAFRLPLYRDAILGLLLAPVLEELIFRDYLMRVLSFNGERWLSAILIATAFFTLAHFSLYPGAFFLGLVNAFLYVRSGGVTLPIVFHFVCNLSWYLMPAFFPNLLGLMENSQIRDLFYR